MSLNNLIPNQRDQMLGIDEESSSPKIKKAQFSPLESVETSDESTYINYLKDIEVEIQAVLGSTQKSLREVLEFKAGSVISLDKLAGDKVDVYVNKEWLALGEVLVLNDQFGIRISLLNSEERVLNKE